MNVLLLFSLRQFLHSLLFWGGGLVLVICYVAFGRSRQDARRLRKMIRKIDHEGVRRMPERLEAVRQGLEDPWPKERERLIKKLKEQSRETLEKEIEDFYKEKDEE